MWWHLYKSELSPDTIFSKYLSPPIQSILCAFSPSFLCISPTTLPLCLASSLYLVICHAYLLADAQYFSEKPITALSNQLNSKTEEFLRVVSDY